MQKVTACIYTCRFNSYFQRCLEIITDQNITELVCQILSSTVVSGPLRVFDLVCFISSVKNLQSFERVIHRSLTSVC